MRKPNYSLERRDRDRKKEAKAAAKADDKRAARAAARGEPLEGEAEPPESSGES